jgi:flagellar biosynthetic protein FliO
MGDYGLLFQSMGFLLLIILLAYIALRYGLRSVYRGFNGGHMQVLERTLLDPKTGSSLVLVRFGKEVMLIGTAQGGVSLIKTLNQIEMDLLENSDETGHTNFKESFARVMEKIRKGSSSGQDDGGTDE